MIRQTAECGEPAVGGGPDRALADTHGHGYLIVGQIEVEPEDQDLTLLAVSSASPAGIVRQLLLSVSTLESHLERSHANLGIHSRQELIAQGARGGSASPR
jgi:DNA-binding CsgD family transcriptional regulator